MEIAGEIMTTETTQEMFQETQDYFKKQIKKVLSKTVSKLLLEDNNLAIEIYRHIYLFGYMDGVISYDAAVKKDTDLITLLSDPNLVKSVNDTENQKGTERVSDEVALHPDRSISLEDVKAWINDNSRIQEEMEKKGMTPEELYKTVDADIESITRVDCHIKEKREALGLSRRKLAEAAGVSIKQLHAFEAGEAEPDVYQAIRIAEWLGCEVEDLYTIYRTTPQSKKESDEYQGGTE